MRILLRGAREKKTRGLVFLKEASAARERERRVKKKKRAPVPRRHIFVAVNTS